MLIDNDAERVKWGEALGIMTLTADASKDETLRQARIDTAAGLVSAISSDAENVYVTLSAKVLNPSLHVAVRASDEQAEEKLQRAGASTVLTPYTYIGHRLAQSLLRPHVVNFLDVASAFGRTDLDLEIEQLPVAPGSFLSSKTLEEGHLGRTYGVIVLAVRRQSGTMQFNPQADVRLEGGDVLIAMGERQKLKQLETELSRVNDGTTRRWPGRIDVEKLPNAEFSRWREISPIWSIRSDLSTDSAKEAIHSKEAAPTLEREGSAGQRCRASILQKVLRTTLPGGTSMSDTVERVTYWHRDLPPIDAEIIGEHTLEAASRHVPGTLAHRDDSSGARATTTS